VLIWVICGCNSLRSKKVLCGVRELRGKNAKKPKNSQKNQKKHEKTKKNDKKRENLRIFTNIYEMAYNASGVPFQSLIINFRLAIFECCLLGQEQGIQGTFCVQSA
jgi:hypothetical protein